MLYSVLSYLQRVKQLDMTTLYVIILTFVIQVSLVISVCYLAARRCRRPSVLLLYFLIDSDLSEGRAAPVQSFGFKLNLKN